MTITMEKILQVAQQGPYTPDWNSLNDFQVPRWFREAKFGIFIHWGLYSVPAFNNEWYSRNMYINGHPEFDHHVATYGPQKEFGYKDFIPLFTAEKFDPDEWLALFERAGARYFFPVAEHHDGFQMYDSELSQFNSVKMGPKRDILGELKNAAEKTALHFCTSSHRAEHWFFFGHGRNFDSDVIEQQVKGDFYWPAMPEPDNQDLYSSPYPTEEFLEDWLLRTCELIDRYQPEVLYFDWWIQHQAFKEPLKLLAAFYYNRGVEWGYSTSISYKHDAMMFGSGIVEIERGKFAEAKPFYWQSDTAIARNSWCYTETLDYKTVKEIIWDLIEVVSKNGNLLLNVGPKADGSIPEKDRDILLTIGDWLQINGEGIYESKVWRQAGEGPTEIAEGQFQENNKTSYTSEDIRFTVKGDSLYAFIMEPTSQQLLITSLAISEDQNVPEFHGIIKKVAVLGQEKPIKSWQQTAAGLEILLPNLDTELPVVCKITME
ncbi:alpha-L-fucosidase [Candidatus Enterococcus leclercqii]|uniref:alpha-L-fucosidase n=1 Tax=Candidatus Enterococcus leclercqii TaxID=1857218 RepID=UPI00137B0146|nr:alpha-L-fucosidase [Enterococcus sp. CU9D]KAF1290778.1 alpha-L-fucosidase [Enterococcus sp. CU9D]